MARLLLFGFLAVTLVLPLADAHEGGTGFHHLSVEVRVLNATESRSYHLESDEGPFREGWIFIVYAGVEGASQVVVNLTHNDQLVDQWTWRHGSYSKNTTRLPATGDYNLTVWNPGPTPTKYAFYFDQSCNCQMKVIPLPGGFVIFNYDLPAGRDALVGFPTLPGWHVRGAVATLRDGTQGKWPQDFDVLVEREARHPGWINFTFQTPATTRYYVFMEAPQGASLEKPVTLTPLVEAPAKSPGVSLPFLTSGIILAVLLVSIWRN